MKRYLVIFASLLFLLAVAFPVFAQESTENFREGEVVTLPEGETINRDFFAFGERVEISGTVNGDVYTAGGTVIVDGQVNGDLLAAGGTLTISGDVSQDVRVAGGQITITGDIGRNLSIGAGNVELTDSARVGGSVLAGAGNLNLAAPVDGDIRAGAGNLTVSSRVGGNIDAGVGSLRLTSKARVGGDINYWSDADASIDSSARVAGNITKNVPPQDAPTSPAKIVGAAGGAVLFFSIVSFISTLVLGLVLIKLFPNFAQNTANTLRKKPWPSLGFGFLALIVTPIVGILLAVTIVGIPLALILFPIYFITLYVVRIYTMLWAGQILSERLNRKINAYWAFVVGAVVYYVVQMIPVVGGIVTFFVLLFSLGATLITKKEAYAAGREKSIL